MFRLEALTTWGTAVVVEWNGFQVVSDSPTFDSALTHEAALADGQPVGLPTGPFTYFSTEHLADELSAYLLARRLVAVGRLTRPVPIPETDPDRIY